MMNILWFSWKDTNHPQAGGAEVVSFNLMKRLVKNGYRVRLITAHYDGANDKDTVEGVEIYRVGGRFSVYLKAYGLYKKQFKKWPDLMIDEMNTIPFGCGIYGKQRSVLLTYQLARRVWFYQMPFPVSLIGYIVEPIYLFILSRFYKTIVTESESTRTDLQKYGFKGKGIHVFRVGIDLSPLKKLESKKNPNHILFLGSVRPMKQTLDAIKAFECAHENDPKLRLLIAGDANGKYANKITKYINNSKHKEVIEVLGRVPQETKMQLMRNAAVILVTSIKEGWGLIVTEANSQGTIAIAYDNDGLRDSVQAGVSGILVKSGDYESMGLQINQLVTNPAGAEMMRHNALKLSKQYTFDNSYKDFVAAVGTTNR